MDLSIDQALMGPLALNIFHSRTYISDMKWRKLQVFSTAIVLLVVCWGGPAAAQVRMVGDQPRGQIYNAVAPGQVKAGLPNPASILSVPLRLTGAALSQPLTPPKVHATVTQAVVTPSEDLPALSALLPPSTVRSLPTSACWVCADPLRVTQVLQDFGERAAAIHATLHDPSSGDSAAIQASEIGTSIFDRRPTRPESPTEVEKKNEDPGVSKSAAISVHEIPGARIMDHTFKVPLDHSDPEKGWITVFASEVVADDKKDNNKLPWMVFFQGGPGFPAPRPSNVSGWLKRALKEYRVLLLDQRGTGQSTPVTTESLLKLGTPQQQADYLKHFRADSIVQDSEYIRKKLLGDRPWTAVGQSFGGFVIAHYLTAAPKGLTAAIFSGGLPPLARGAENVYRATYKQVLEKNRIFYERFPSDKGKLLKLFKYLAEHEVLLPGGGRLTARRFQQLGIEFGFSGGIEEIHNLIKDPFTKKGGLRAHFLRSVESMQQFETHPLYVLLHEAIYSEMGASRWAAERMRAKFPAFEISDKAPIYFTGEMMFPWMFEDYKDLRPLKEAADILAAYDGWPRLYDADKLKRNKVPVAAILYVHDMYVNKEFSEHTAKTILGAKVWRARKYEHDGLFTDGENVLDKLLRMVKRKN